jgi:hypothetical protein
MGSLTSVTIAFSEVRDWKWERSKVPNSSEMINYIFEI